MLLSLIRGDPAFSMLQPIPEQFWDARGGVLADEPWVEIEFTALKDAGGEFIAADCLTMNTGTDGFLLSGYAKQMLSPLLSEVGQFLPVRVMGQPYWWLNCLALVEALDRSKTDADWSVVSGDWGSFSWISTTRRLAFKASQLKRAPVLFRIPEYPQGVLFALDTLRSAVVEHGLTGFKFDPVWSTHEGGVVDPVGLGFGGMFDPVSVDDVTRIRQAARDVLSRRDQSLGI